jgi:hypothetical protein
MRYVFITSPAGSGTNFALALIHTTYDITCISRGHERKDIEDGVHQISVLRNPYDCIASGAERWLVGSGHLNFIGNKNLTTIDKIHEVKERIGWEEKRYREFFKDIESLDHVKLVSFELLTKNPGKFLEITKDFFNIKKVRKNPSEEEILKAASSEGRGNRIPRAGSEDRKIINDLMLEMYPKETWECWKIYSDLKSKLDEEGL